MVRMIYYWNKYHQIVKHIYQDMSFVKVLNDSNLHISNLNILHKYVLLYIISYAFYGWFPNWDNTLSIETP